MLGLGIGIGFGGAPSSQAFVATSVAGCKLWLRASLGITLNGSNVSAWADQSGNNRNASQVTAAWQPLYVASAVNGQPSLRCNGTSQFITTGAFTLAQPFTYWLVMKQITSSGAVVACDASAADKAGLLQGTSPAIALYSGASVASNSNLTIGSYGLVQAIFDGASSSLAVGAHAATTGNPGATGFVNGLSLGADPSPRFYANVEIAEFILYDHHLSAGDTATVLAGLTALYGAGV